MTGPAERYLASIVEHRWEDLASLVREDVVRTGPDGDVTTGRDAYVSYLARLMPALPGYAMEMKAVTYSGRTAFCELAETVIVNGTTVVTNEVLVVRFDADGLVEEISIFTQKVPAAQP